MKLKTRKAIDLSASWLLIIGGLVHLGQAFNWYAVDVIFASWAWIVYGLVGISAVYTLIRIARKKFMK